MQNQSSGLLRRADGHRRLLRYPLIFIKDDVGICSKPPVVRTGGEVHRPVELLSLCPFPATRQHVRSENPCPAPNAYVIVRNSRNKTSECGAVRTQDNHMVQALASNGSDQPFAIFGLPRRTVIVTPRIKPRSHSSFDFELDAAEVTFAPKRLAPVRERFSVSLFPWPVCATTASSKHGVLPHQCRRTSLPSPTAACRDSGGL
jgi:hypothetical protein